MTMDLLKLKGEALAHAAEEAMGTPVLRLLDPKTDHAKLLWLLGMYDFAKIETSMPNMPYSSQVTVALLSGKQTKHCWTGDTQTEALCRLVVAVSMELKGDDSHTAS